jgi:hypothetical protein
MFIKERQSCRYARAFLYRMRVCFPGDDASQPRFGRIAALREPKTTKHVLETNSQGNLTFLGFFGAPALFCR